MLRFNLIPAFPQVILVPRLLAGITESPVVIGLIVSYSARPALLPSEAFGCPCAGTRKVGRRGSPDHLGQQWKRCPCGSQSLQIRGIRSMT
jgi:hypothetical protein